MKIDIIILIGLTLVLVIGLSIALVVSAQTPTTDKVFRKDFCLSENNLLDDILYPDGNQLSYDSTGCPESVKIIHRWNELTTIQQNLITTRLTSIGYESAEIITGGEAR